MATVQIKTLNLNSYSGVAFVEVDLDSAIQAENRRFAELAARYSCDCHSFHCTHAKAARAEARRVILAGRLINR